ncbi:MAG TPA: multiheme c-type cytochrome [Dongiaceae bacterium]|nr:multiheme c-type cytochrome [Dongiaceae bacterium]
MYVDTGDFTGDPTVPGDKQTEALVDGMNQMGYRAVGVGPRELGHGWEKFAARRARSSFPWLSANLVFKDTAKPIVDPFQVVEVPLRKSAKAKSVKIAFTSVTMNNPAFLANGPDGRAIVTVDPAAAIGGIITAMRDKADLVVVLSGIDLAKARDLARQVKGIDFIVGGYGGIQTRTDDFPEDSTIGKTRIQYIGDQGKNLGEVRLAFDSKRVITNAQRTVVGLTREWPDDPALVQLMTATRVAVNDYNRAQADLTNPFNTPAPGTSGAGAVPAAPSTAPGAAPAGAPAAAPTAAPAGAPATAAAAAVAYTGSARCQPCHEKEYAVWAGSAHAKAFDILVKSQQDYNPTCVGCHVIGWQKSGGFVNATATPALVHVGCEACHGASSLHPDSGAPYRGATLEGCRTCHTRENSPDFNPNTYIPKVIHWGEAKAAR